MIVKCFRSLPFTKDILYPYMVLLRIFYKINNFHPLHEAKKIK